MNRKGHLRGDKKPFKCPFLQFVRKKFAVCAKSYNRNDIDRERLKFGKTGNGADV